MLPVYCTKDPVITLRSLEALTENWGQGIQWYYNVGCMYINNLKQALLSVCLSMLHDSGVRFIRSS